MKLLLDTNVYLDFLAQREPYKHEANKLFIASYFGDIELWVSTQSICDAEYIMVRRGHAKADFRRAVLNSSEYIHPCGTHAQDALEALRGEWPDIEDGVIALSSKRIDADYLVTRDSKGFAQAPVRAVSPAEMLSIIERDEGLAYDEIALDER